MATGNMNAQEAARVAGSINQTGETPITSDADSNIGSTSWVVAVLDVNSVKRLIPAETLKITSGRLAFFKP